MAALDEVGIDSRPAVWSDASVDWLAFDALVVRSPWDYFVRVREFRAWLDARIASGVRMCNSSEIIAAAPALPVYARVDGVIQEGLARAIQGRLGANDVEQRDA